MTREDVYKLIDGERDYQEAIPLHSDKVQQMNTPIAAWIIFMQNKLREAEDRIYLLDEEAALESIRKVTALGVAAMEHNETNPRR